MVTVFILEKHIRRQFFEYTYKVKLANFQLPSFRRSAVTNENSLGGAGSAPPGKVGLRVRTRLSLYIKQFIHVSKCIDDLLTSPLA